MSDLHSLFNQQKEFFYADTTKTFEWRMCQLEKLEKLLLENQEKLCEALSQDFKTAWFEQGLEFNGALGALAEAKACLEDWMRPEPVRLSKAMTETGHKGTLMREPYGVSLIIAPFNAPLILLVAPLIAALAAGNTAIIKPSEMVPCFTSLFVELVTRYFEPEAVSMVRGTRQVVTELLKLPFDFIFFTGSTKVGKIVMRAAAENLTPLILELGGQNAAIVDETANLKDAAEKLVWGAMAFGGQWCVSPGYVYVHNSVADEFAKACSTAVEKMYGKDPKTSKDFSRIISEYDVDRLSDLLKGTNVLVGGEYDRAERYFAPTIVFPAHWNDALMQEEIFGPILPILLYSDLSEVVEKVKRQPKCLSTYIFSRDQTSIKHLLNSLSFGGGAVNQAMIHIFVSGMPFGGVGSSGLGRYAGKYGFDSFSHTKPILMSEADFQIDALIPPNTLEKAGELASWFAPPEGI